MNIFKIATKIIKEDKKYMRVHFIAIGGAIMHNLAMALHNKGYQVTGSDDEIFEPSRGRLEKYGLLPAYKGWDPSVIKSDIEAIILGMHAREDNPELLRAKQLGIKIYSFPAFMYEKTKNKTRIVVAGSHGKTTITSMILHVLKNAGIKFDYLVGSQIDGFETMVNISDDSNIAIFEGDEYLTSPLDKVPKFYHYKPHIAVLSGIEWDHFNVFPTFEIYLDQFRLLIKRMVDGGKLFYDGEDQNIPLLDLSNRKNINTFPYKALSYRYQDGQTRVSTENGKYTLQLFGNHNMKNINAAKLVCNEVGIEEKVFFKKMETFTGAARRLELVFKKNDFLVYNDFAHAPSKVRATVNAVKERHPDKKLIAIFELHTFSSLNADFLPQYTNTLNTANEAIVLYNKAVLEQKKLKQLDNGKITTGFNRKDIQIINDAAMLEAKILGMDQKNSVLLLMSSGNFLGVDLVSLVKKL